MPYNDDLSDVVPSAKFYAEFPDGRVPIRYTSHLIFRDPENQDVYQALIDTIDAFEATRRILRSMTATEVMSKIDEYVQTPVSHTADRQAILHELAREGLSIRAIMNLLPEPPERRRRSLSTMITSKPQTLTDAQIDTILAADDAMLRGDTREMILAATGISPATLRCIERFRTPALVGYEGALRWAFHQMMSGINTATVLRKMHEEFPDVAALIPPHTVYALVRPHRLERNKQRFGWADAQEGAA